MKKYKLIEEYPGSPTLGYITDLSKIKCDKIEGFKCIDEKWEVYKKDIINNPKFWEEVVEYPIGTIATSIYTNNTLIKKEDGWYSVGCILTLLNDEHIRNRKHIKIIDE